MSSPQRLFFVNVGLVNLLQIQLQLWPSFQPDASTLTEISVKKKLFFHCYFSCQVCTENTRLSVKNILPRFLSSQKLDILFPSFLEKDGCS